jgi:hypothetical protein
MKKKERQIVLLKEYKNYVNETNIYSKNLKPSITIQDIENVFS